MPSNPDNIFEVIYEETEHQKIFALAEGWVSWEIRRKVVIPTMPALPGYIDTPYRSGQAIPESTKSFTEQVVYLPYDKIGKISTELSHSSHKKIQELIKDGKFQELQDFIDKRQMTYNLKLFNTLTNDHTYVPVQFTHDHMKDILMRLKRKILHST